jgi:hypothetical protein
MLDTDLDIRTTAIERKNGWNVAVPPGEGCAEIELARSANA